MSKRPKSPVWTISIHAPTRGATYAVAVFVIFEDAISIHAPTRGATRTGRDPHSTLRDFNPRSHEGSDNREEELLHPRYEISIHAPTRGATLPCLDADDLVRISIHAPTRGATMLSLYKPMRVAISIHAPTRGATFLVVNQLISIINFNPRSHEGSDS